MGASSAAANTAVIRNIVVVSGGLGVPSTSRMLGDRIAEAAAQSVEALGGKARVDVVELREYAGDIANAMVSRYASPRLQAAIDLVTGADALVAVSPVFTASVSGLFKSFLDVLDPSALSGMPVVLAATGGSARHSLVIDYALRPVFAYLKADVTPTGVFAAPDDWGGEGESGNDDDALTSRTRRAGRELGLALTAGATDGPAGAAPGVNVGANSIEAAGMTSMPFEDLLASINGNRVRV
ncbi:FMN reductase [Zhihengliuella halotolerans]|uniref:FMN reductase n=1 Tax=Zhihengliuella halotolerans TaxID=370736 RepID=UPI000C8059C8|nr:FMN reductase [Zhihengliuella halotolerans]